MAVNAFHLSTATAMGSPNYRAIKRANKARVFAGASAEFGVLVDKCCIDVIAILVSAYAAPGVREPVTELLEDSETAERRDACAIGALSCAGYHYRLRLPSVSPLLLAQTLILLEAAQS
jgi:hypothetical protein